MDSISGFGIGLTIIDGALSRKSSASPAVSEAMVLATGAALSCNMPALVDRTAFCVEMIRLPEVESQELPQEHILTVSSMAPEVEIAPEVRRVEVSGALTDRLLTRLLTERRLPEIEVTVADFTRIFILRRTGGVSSVQEEGFWYTGGQYCWPYVSIHWPPTVTDWIRTCFAGRFPTGFNCRFTT